jgi:hypothetical protein
MMSGGATLQHLPAYYQNRPTPLVGSAHFISIHTHTQKQI